MTEDEKDRIQAEKIGPARGLAIGLGIVAVIWIIIGGLT